MIRKHHHRHQVRNIAFCNLLILSILADILGHIMEKEKTSNSPKTTPKPTGPILGLPDDDPNGNYLTFAIL